MKKKYCIISAMLILSTFSFCSCATETIAKEEPAIVSPTPSNEAVVYTKDDISRAISAATAYFEEHFDGCNLTAISYEGEVANPSNAEWAKQYKEDEAIVLVSSFDVGPKGPDGSFDTNCTYDNFQWILTRSGSNDWTVQDYGY